MSVGNLVVELRLEDGQYQASMRNAGQAAQTLSGTLNTLGTRVGGVDKGFTSMLPHLRDIAIVTSSLHSIFSGFIDTFGKLASSFIKSNADIERTTVLLMGLSKSLDIHDKAADAAKDMKFLFDTAKNSPFALSELTNSFVKMRAVGIGDAELKVKTLSNAIASFGGDNEALHRSTVAIQQMASKGVISMEELRQQLGESVPNAMNMMADSMGMTMATLVKNISEGRVLAIPAINGMMKEMELSMEGSSRRMMETWTGMASQLSTNWMLLQKQIGDAGSFDAAKEALKELNTFLQGNDALQLGKDIGKSMGDAIVSIIDATKTFAKYKDTILSTGEAALWFWGITKAIKPAQALLMGFLGTLGATGTAMASLNATTALWTAAMVRQNVVTTVTMGGLMNLVRTVDVATVSVGALARATAFANATFSTLLGPIGLVITGLGLLAYEYYKTTHEATDNLDILIKKQNELNANGNLRISGDSVLKTIEDVTKAKEDLARLKREQSSDSANPNAPSYGEDSKFVDTKGYEERARKIKVLTQAIIEGQEALFDNSFEKSSKSISDKILYQTELNTTSFKKRVEEINEIATAQMNEVGVTKKTQKEIDEIKHNSMLKLHKEVIDDSIATNTELKKKAEASLDDISKQGNSTTLFKFVDEKNILEDLNKARIAVISGVEKIKYDLRQARQSGKAEDVAGLEKSLTMAQSGLDALMGKIKTTEGSLKGLKGTTIDVTIIDNFTSAYENLQAYIDKLSGLDKEKKQNDRHQLPSEGALTQNETKALESEQKQLGQLQRQLAVSLEKFIGDGNPKLAKQLSREYSGDNAVRPETEEEVSSIVKSGKDFKKGSSGSVLADSISLLKEDPNESRSIDSIRQLNVKVAELSGSLDKQLETQTAILKYSDEDVQTLQKIQIVKGKTVTKEHTLLDSLDKQYGFTPGRMDGIWSKESSRGTNLGKGGQFGTLKAMASDYGIRDVTNFEQSAPAVAKFLAHLDKRFESEDLGTAAYNAGPENIKKYGMDALNRGGADPNYVSGVRAQGRTGQEFQEESLTLSSTDTIKRRREVQAQRDKGITPDDGDLAALRVSEALDADKKILEDAKKTDKEIKQYDRELNQDIIAVKRIKVEENYKLNKEVSDSQVKLTQDGKLLYAQDIADYKSAIEQKFKANKKVLGESHDAYIAEKMAQHQEKLNNDANLVIKQQGQASQFHLNDTSITRSVNTSQQRDIEMINEKYRQEIIVIQQTKKAGVEMENELHLLEVRHKDDIEGVKFSHQTAFQKMMQDTVDFSQVAGDAGAQFTNGMIDGFAQLATNGTQSFKQFTASVLQGIAQMMIKMAALALMQQAIGMVGGIMSAAGGVAAAGEAAGATVGAASLSASSVGGASAWAGTAAQNSALSTSMVSTPMSIAPFANGGIMTPNGSLPLPSLSQLPLKMYSNGGIANSPQLALFGEGKMNEAYVPLPDGRTIPVTMTSKGGGGNGAITIQINVDNSGGVTSTKQGTDKSSGPGSSDNSMWTKMADNIKGVVMQTISEQKRPGGQLYMTGS